LWGTGIAMRSLLDVIGMGLRQAGVRAGVARRCSESSNGLDFLNRSGKLPPS
jgi:hypothetical protein